MTLARYSNRARRSNGAWGLSKPRRRPRRRARRRDEGDSVRTRAIDAAPFVVRAVREETMSVLGVRLTVRSGGT